MAHKCLHIWWHKVATSPSQSMLSLTTVCYPICCDSFLHQHICADLVSFSQALETLDNGKPYVISYLVDLDMVLKCFRYGLRLPVLFSYCTKWLGMLLGK